MATASTNTSQQQRPQQDVDLVKLQARVAELRANLTDKADGEEIIPSEEQLLRVLKEYQRIAQQLVDHKDATPKPKQKTKGATATSALLSSVNKTQTSSSVTKAIILSAISNNSLDLAMHPNVFITPEVLKMYISLQTLLGQPESFPEILNLYRTKPAPRQSGSQIVYSGSSPSSPSAAVPPAIADDALSGAITAHDLSLALSITDNTYCTQAYKRAKFLRSALFPIAGAVLTPLAAYTLASRFSDIQNTMDPSSATGIAMAGILTYTTAVATIGYVALTTANDQMVRVTWATGMPLWERWVREEERSAVDRIAQAWGFKSQDRWGEEEGVEWETLKEWTGLRGMVLDRVELMEGME